MPRRWWRSWPTWRGERLVAVSGDNGAPPAGPAGAARPLELAAGLPWAPPRLVRHEAPLNQILSNPFDPCVPLAE